jgi:hypothetical protein
MIPKPILLRLYIKEKKSAKAVAKLLGHSEGKVNYWLDKYCIPKRTISEAVYVHKNPKGDPFVPQKINTRSLALLYGIGLGLYWGEGTKSDRFSVRLGNSDPELIKKFIEFLEKIYLIRRSQMRYGLQIFSNDKPKPILSFWKRTLKASDNQFYKIVITPTRGEGTYKHKAMYGVLTIYFHNKRLRDLICNEIKNL